MLATGCGGPEFGFGGTGTQFCAPTRYVDGKVINEQTGQPYKWRPRSKQGASQLIELDRGDHNDLKDRHCKKGDDSYLIELTLRICFDAGGKTVSSEVKRHSGSKSFDNRLATAAKKIEYCPFPRDFPQTKPHCFDQRLEFRSPCD